MTEPAHDKATARAVLRSDLRARRKAFVAGGKPPIARTTEVEALLRSARCVGGYWPIPSEADPLPLLDWCHLQGIRIALPYIAERGAVMRFKAWQPDAPLETAPFGFRQPHSSAPDATPDLLLIPLVGFDAAGNRLGQGAGHYDRYIAAHPAVQRVGIGFSCQQELALPAEPWDAPLDSVVSEHGLIRCSAKAGMTS